MMNASTLRRAALLTLTLLSACAANDVGLDDSYGIARFKPTGAFGAYLTGRYAASRTDLDTAAEQFQAALDEDESNPELIQRAFLAAVSAGRPEAARLAARLPGNLLAQLVLADQDAKARRWDVAERRFAALPADGLTGVLKPLMIAWAQQGNDRTDLALATLRPEVDGTRFRGVFALHSALIADAGSRPGEAATLYRTALASYGGLNLRLAQSVASWQARTGHPDEARQTISDLVAANPELALAGPALTAAAGTPAVPRPIDGMAESYLAFAGTLRQQAVADQAEIMLRLALDLRPEFTPARLLLADIQDGLHRPGAALQTLNAVPSDDPLAAVARLRQAALLQEQGKAADANKMLEQLARDFPNRPEPLVVEADILRRGSQFAEAAAVLDRAVARVPQPGPTDWPLFYQRGVALERSGHWDRAEGDFQRALQLAPDQPLILNYLGYAWTERGSNLAQARAMIERAAALRPNDGSIVDSLGWVQLRQGDTRAAIGNLEHAVELEPEDATINEHLGDAYLAAGRQREAEFQWRRALTLKPEPDDAAKIESKLRGLPTAAHAAQ